MKKIFFLFVFFLFLCSCSNKITFVNKKFVCNDSLKTYSLLFLNDSTCIYKQLFLCDFPKPYKEVVIICNYTIEKKTIILSKQTNNYDSIDVSWFEVPDSIFDEYFPIRKNAERDFFLVVAINSLTISFMAI